MRSHLKVYFSFEDDAQALDDSEKGRLLLSMLRYAKDGTESDLTGNERFLFPVFRAQIDRDIEAYDIKASNGSKGGKSKSEINQTEANESKPKQTEANESKITEIAKIEDRRYKIEDRRQKIKDKEHTESAFALFWDAYPRKEAKPKAHDAFAKINPDDELLARMLSAIEKWKASDQWKEDGGRYIPHPTTWLNQHRWLDEPQNRIGGGHLPAQQYDQRDYSGYSQNPDDILDRLEAMK